MFIRMSVYVSTHEDVVVCMLCVLHLCICHVAGRRPGELYCVLHDVNTWQCIPTETAAILLVVQGS